MFSGPSDTSREVEEIQLELFRQASPAKRFALMDSFSSSLKRASMQRHEAIHGKGRAAQLSWVREQYGDELADKLEQFLETHER